MARLLALVQAAGLPVLAGDHLTPVAGLLVLVGALRILAVAQETIFSLAAQATISMSSTLATAWT